MPESRKLPAERRRLIQNSSHRRRFRLWILLFITLGLACLLVYGRPADNPLAAQGQVSAPSTQVTPSLQAGESSAASPTSRPTGTPRQSPTPGSSPTATSAAAKSPNPSATPEQPLPLLQSLAVDGGTIFLSILEDGYYHLYAYHPQLLPFTRLTYGAWDDISPAASPDGQRLAFASNRHGHWDLYVLDLATGELNQLTDTPEYDAAPSWSPDGQWLVYESYAPLPIEVETKPSETATATPTTTNGQSLDIFIRPAANAEGGSAEPIRLTSDPAADYAPSWSPGGRLIAFVSNRSGDDEIWLADLDQVEGRFRNVSRSPRSKDRFPAWSPDGQSLAWASSADGYQTLHLLEQLTQPARPRPVGNGARPAFSPGGNILFTAVTTPNRFYLTGYAWRAAHFSAGSAGLALPAIPIEGSLNGLSWSPASLPQPLPLPIARAALATPTPAWLAGLTPAADIPGSRQRVVPLNQVQAPYPYLHDLVDESFNALRSTLSARIGWDFLSTLENAYLPLTTPLFPGMLDDWLYTGRAFCINAGAMNAGWMVVIREEYGPDIYWRIYLRTRYQDGSQGMPLYDLPWNFNARYSGDPRYYEQGGAYAQAIPAGYWFDLTSLAASYGWERLPALLTWRSAIPAARFNEFVLSDGLDWPSAMLELYPASALVTPTPVSPPTLTPTRTRWPTRTPFPTRTPLPTRTPQPTASITPATLVAPSASP